MMQLKSLSVRNFKKFVDPVNINGLAPGINIIAGSNEDGKSTLVQAVKSALYTKHSTSATQGLQPYNSSALPEVELEFELDSLAYRLRKTFGKKGTAELRAASAIFNGSEAEEQLQRLLGLGGEKTKENSSIWNVLWVEQGTAFLSPQIGDVGKRTLQTALESELGKIVSGNDGQHLLRRINDLYLQWFTPKSNQNAANSELRKAEKELLEITAQYAKLSAEFENYRATLAQMESTRSALQQHEQASTVQTAATALTAAQQAYEQIEKNSAALEKLQAIEAGAAAQYRTHSEIWQTRSQLAKSCDEMQAALAELRRQLEAATKEFETVSITLHQCQQQEENAEQLLAAAEATCAHLETSTKRAQLLAHSEQLQNNLQKAQIAHQLAATTRAQAAAISIDRTSLENLRKLERQLVQLEAQLQAVGTKLTFRPKPGKHITANGANVEPNEAVLLTEVTTFELEDWGHLEVVPGAEGLDKLQSSTADLKLRFQSALAHLGVESIEQAENQEREKANFLQQADEQLREVLRYAPAGVDALSKALSGVQQQLASLPVDTAAADGGTAKVQLPSLAEMEQTLQTARLNRDELRKKLLPLKEAAQRAARQLGEIGVRVQTLTGQEKTQQNTWQTQSEKLAQARQQATDDKLEQQVMEHRHLKDEATKNREQLAAGLQGQDPGKAAAIVQQAKDHLESVQRAVQTLREKLSELSGSLQTFGKAGIAEEFQKTKDKKEQSEAVVARLGKRAAAVKLLYETLTQAERSSKNELLQPLVNHLEPYIKQVFDDGNLIFDTNTYAITNLQRAGSVEQYDNLSLGTREQLSVLMRLAFAHVLVENGSPAVVILDDALVYSDYERFLKMQSAITAAAASFQVLILTCRLRDWENLGAPVIHIPEQTSFNHIDPTLSLRVAQANY
jgi:DNA repair exonuclease SbcCD ATPase subunit